MTAWTITFYRWMLWWMNYGLTIARSTGRNPELVGRQAEDIQSIKSTIHKLEINQ
jgi:hypothetical protein